MCGVNDFAKSYTIEVTHHIQAQHTGEGHAELQVEADLLRERRAVTFADLKTAVNARPIICCVQNERTITTTTKCRRVVSKRVQHI